VKFLRLLSNCAELKVLLKRVGVFFGRIKVHGDLHREGAEHAERAGKVEVELSDLRRLCGEYSL
jgi:hypothetical protein